MAVAEEVGLDGELDLLDLEGQYGGCLVQEVEEDIPQEKCRHGGDTHDGELQREQRVRGEWKRNMVGFKAVRMKLPMGGRACGDIETRSPDAMLLASGASFPNQRTVQISKVLPDEAGEELALAAGVGRIASRAQPEDGRVVLLADAPGHVALGVRVAGQRMRPLPVVRDLVFAREATLIRRLAEARASGAGDGRKFHEVLHGGTDATRIAERAMHACAGVLAEACEELLLTVTIARTIACAQPGAVELLAKAPRHVTLTVGIAGQCVLPADVVCGLIAEVPG
mmetsp:Transcript_100599/g.289052  ORF Transcript_100599/g.289052 Transcript_100599/m.289052 type:complete len:283 (-) Transcript_100599:50-898(-)